VLRRLLSSFAWQLKFVVRTATPELLAADLEEIEGLLATLEIGPEARERVLLMPEGTDASSEFRRRTLELELEPLEDSDASYRPEGSRRGSGCGAGVTSGFERRASP
jgi:hypothetical protein